MVRTQISPLYPHALIQERVRAMSQQINALYADEPLVAVCVLKGAVVFFADLVRGITDSQLTLDFVRLASYGSGTESSRKIRFERDLDTDITGRHVLIVEDVVDTGHTMQFLFDVLKKRNPLSLRLATLVDKNERREVDVQVDFSAFQINRGFIVGYGLDYSEKYRALPDICVLDFIQN